MIADFSPEIHTQNGFDTTPANDDSPIEGLSARHYRMLHVESGIRDEVIRERSARTCSGYSELKSLGISIRRDTDTHGILLPLHTTDGKQATVFVRDVQAPLTIYRPDEPQYDKNDKLRKYLLPTGASMRLDCPPRCRSALQDPSIPLWITEGQKKGDALASHDACVVVLPGVTCWRGTNAEGGKTVLADWEHIALNDRHVCIVFDNDVMTKRDVRNALERLTNWLQSKGAVVSIAYLPATGKKLGVDDYLLDHSMQDLGQLLRPAGEQPHKQTVAAATTNIPLKLNEYGRPRPILWNAGAILRQDPAWAGAFRFNLLTRKTELHAVPQGFLDDTTLPRPIEDSDLTLINLWLQERYDLFCSTGIVAEAIDGLASQAPYHPVREYLHGLTWDRKPRLDTWLIDRYGADDTPYTRAVGSKFCIAAVARAADPGCKVDNALILQGPQGFKKSSGLLSLFGKRFYGENVPRDLGNKDTKTYIQEWWAAELAELSQLKRSEVEDAKAFITAQADTFRAAYGRKDRKYPRQCVFTGTANQDVLFRDETGNRRFWPIRVHTPGDIAGIERDRDQLWAEAFARYQAGEKWYLEGDLEKAAQAEQEARVEQDPWMSDITEFIDTTTLRTTTYRGRQTVFVTVDELLEHLGIDKAHRDMFMAHRVGRCLRLMYWTGAKVEYRADAQSKRQQVRAFIPPQPEPEPEPLEPLDGKPSGSASDPHKTLLEPLEPLEPLEIETKSESSVRQSDCPDLYKQTRKPRFMEFKQNPVPHSGSNGSASKTHGNTTSYPEPLALSLVAQPPSSSGSTSGSAPTHTLGDITAYPVKNMSQYMRCDCGSVEFYVLSQGSYRCKPCTDKASR